MVQEPQLDTIQEQNQAEVELEAPLYTYMMSYRKIPEDEEEPDKEVLEKLRKYHQQQTKAQLQKKEKMKKGSVSNRTKFKIPTGSNRSTRPTGERAFEEFLQLAPDNMYVCKTIHQIQRRTSQGKIAQVSEPIVTPI